MTDTPWTDGPWAVEFGDHIMPQPSVTASGGRPDGWIICDMGVPTELVWMAREDIAEPILAEQSANAHLIASSPTMFDALKTAQPIVCKATCSDEGHSAECIHITATIAEVINA